MPPHFDDIIIGLGGMGSAAALQLVTRGRRILGLEQHGIPHSLGSSHGHSRLVRQSYYEHPDYVPLLRRSFELFRDLEQRTGERLLHLTGGLYLGPEGCELVEGSIRAARDHGLEHRVLSSSQLAAEFPQFGRAEDRAALYEPNAGIALSDRSVAANATAALLLGAQIHAHEPVVDWHADARAVRVRTTHVEYTADRLIIAGGAWSSTLLAGLGIPLTVSRQAVGWVWPRDHRPFCWPDAGGASGFPCWATHAPRGIYYGAPVLHPSIGGGVGMKIGHHLPGRAVAPEELRDPALRSPTPADEQEVLAAFQSIFPGCDAALLGVQVCLYTNTPDSHFIIDRHPVHQNVVFAAGFSGHGFKFTPVVGQILADLAVNGHTSLPIGFLGLNRLRNPTTNGR